MSKKDEFLKLAPGDQFFGPDDKSPHGYFGYGLWDGSGDIRAPLHVSKTLSGLYSELAEGGVIPFHENTGAVIVYRAEHARKILKRVAPDCDPDRFHLFRDMKHVALKR